MSDNAFAAYFEAETAPTTPQRPQSKRSRRRRREAEPQTIGTNPPTWPPPDPEPELDDDAEPDYRPPAYTDAAAQPPLDVDVVDEDGFSGDWNDWTEPAPGEDSPPPRGDDVDWNDWATATATEQSGDYDAPPTLPRLTSYGGGGKIARRPRKNYDDERFDEKRGRSKAAAALTGVVGAGVLVTLIGLAAITFGSEDAATSTPTVVAGSAATATTSPTVVVPPLPAWALSGCEDFRSASITISAEAGDTATPQGAILGFEHSYFVARDAAKVRSFTTDNGETHVGDQSALAEGIAALVPDVKYCVHILRADSTDKSAWAVTLHQKWPGDTEVEKIAFVIRTTEVSPGTHKIASITYK
ncbi:hypothetical protein [Nocardia sp. NPDC059195]|uniref:hypothetical protein n=1 Tax=Nocardia sp. NPDC059195 TaxID=3346765 RepID=UPI0036966EC6